VIGILLVDDDQLMRAGLRLIVQQAPDLTVVSEAADGREAVAAARRDRPQVVVMDVRMPVLDGIEATRRLAEQAPAASVLVLTSFSDRRRITGALDAGAVGYLLKDAAAEEVVRGIRAAAQGGSPLDPRAARSLLEAKAAPDPLDTLSAREREVLGLLLEGLPNKLIARRLQISEKTVKTHLTRVFRALGVTDRVQAVLWAERHGVRADLTR
jgi:DNA-binding NarL/FixJ family response regulator